MKNYFFSCTLLIKYIVRNIQQNIKEVFEVFFGKMPLNMLIIRSAKKVKKEYKDIVDFFIKLIIFQLNI